MFATFSVVGLFICFAGRMLFKPVVFILGVFLMVSLVWLIFYSTFLSDTTKPWVGWVVLIVSILLGLLVGFLFMKLIRLSAFIVAGWGGFCFGMLIYNSFLYMMHS